MLFPHFGGFPTSTTDRKRVRRQSRCRISIRSNAEGRETVTAALLCFGGPLRPFGKKPDEEKNKGLPKALFLGVVIQATNV